MTPDEMRGVYDTVTDKIVINGRFLAQPVTGVQRVGIEFCLALDELLVAGYFPDLSVEIVVPSRLTLVTDLGLRRVKIRRAGRLRGHLWEQLQLPWFARGSQLLALGNTAPAVSLLTSARQTHVMVHDLSYRYFPEAYTRHFRWWYEIIVPIVLRRASTVFTVSETERAAILREYPRLRRPERIVAVQNGSSKPVSSSIAGRAERGRNCLYVGSLTRRKNAEGLIRSAIDLVQNHDASFTFIGSTGTAFEGVGITVPADVADRITFLGQVNDPADLSAAYSAASVFVFPSFYEASPLPPIEAMVHGCPVVASDIPSLRERCGAAASYCDPSSQRSIVDAVVALLDNDLAWQQQQDIGLRKAASYSWHRQAARIVARVIGDSNAGGRWPDD